MLEIGMHNEFAKRSLDGNFGKRDCRNINLRIRVGDGGGHDAGQALVVSHPPQGQTN
jgi:hypothetical protein